MTQTPEKLEAGSPEALEEKRKRLKKIREFQNKQITTVKQERRRQQAERKRIIAEYEKLAKELIKEGLSQELDGNYPNYSRDIPRFLYDLLPDIKAQLKKHNKEIKYKYPFPTNRGFMVRFFQGLKVRYQKYNAMREARSQILQELVKNIDQGMMKILGPDHKYKQKVEEFIIKEKKIARNNINTAIKILEEARDPASGIQDNVISKKYLGLLDNTKKELEILKESSRGNIFQRIKKWLLGQQNKLPYDGLVEVLENLRKKVASAEIDHLKVQEAFAEYKVKEKRHKKLAARIIAKAMLRFNKEGVKKTGVSSDIEEKAMRLLREKDIDKTRIAPDIREKAIRLFHEKSTGKTGVPSNFEPLIDKAYKILKEETKRQHIDQSPSWFRSIWNSLTGNKLINPTNWLESKVDEVIGGSLTDKKPINSTITEKELYEALEFTKLAIQKQIEKQETKVQELALRKMRDMFKATEAGEDERKTKPLSIPTAQLIMPERKEEDLSGYIDDPLSAPPRTRLSRPTAQLIMPERKEEDLRGYIDDPLSAPPRTRLSRPTAGEKIAGITAKSQKQARDIIFESLNSLAEDRSTPSSIPKHLQGLLDDTKNKLKAQQLRIERENEALEIFGTGAALTKNKEEQQEELQIIADSMLKDLIKKVIRVNLDNNPTKSKHKGRE